MRRAPKIAHDHPEAVIEGHRDAQPVTCLELDRLRHKEAIVEHVAVR
ncbi:Uncharacterised protein [Mycobacteroides abscessus subsp. massiliense]|nr:Uncharacterised protein [Mycobacteroides abscessus subsp. massiliense]